MFSNGTKPMVLFVGLAESYECVCYFCDLLVIVVVVDLLLPLANWRVKVFLS